MASNGTVLWFSFTKGFGFATLDSGASSGGDIEDVFIHRSQLASAQIRQMNEGTTLSFDIEVTDKGPECRNVEVIEAVTPVRAERPTYPANALHVGGMTVGTDESELAALFSDYQTTHVSVVASRPDSRASHGVVCLENEDDLEAAVAALNGATMGDATLAVEIKRGQRRSGNRGGGRAEGGEGNDGEKKKKKRRPKKIPEHLPNALHIGNVSWELDDETFASLFAGFNTTSVEIVRQGGGRSRGFGVVCLETPEEMEKVISEVHGKEVDGRPLVVEAKGASGERKEERN